MKKPARSLPVCQDSGPAVVSHTGEGSGPGSFISGPAL